MTSRLKLGLSTFFAAIVPFAVISIVFAAANPQSGSGTTNGSSILYADQFPGADDGARISSAIAGCANVPSCVVDARSLKNLSAAETITINMPATIYFPHGSFTLGGAPGINITSPGVTLQGSGMSSAAGSRSPTVLQTNSPTADIVQVSAPFSHISNLLFRTTVARSGGAAIQVKAGHTYVDHVRIERTYDGIDIKSPNSGGNFENMEMGKGQSVADNWNAGLYVGGVHSGLISNPMFNNLLIGADEPFATALVVLDDGVDTPEFSNCSIVAFSGTDSTALLVRHTARGVPPQWISFTNCGFAGGYASPAIDVEYVRGSISFKNIFENQSLQGIVVRHGAVDVDGGWIILNQQEGVRANPGASVSVHGVHIGDNGLAANNTYADIFVAPGNSDFSLTGNFFGDINFAHPANRTSYNIEVAAGVSDRYSIINNVFGNSATGGLKDAGTGSHKVVFNTNGTSSSWLPGPGLAPDGPALKHKRFQAPLGGSCPTAASADAVCTSGNLNWTTPFADDNYTVSCTLTSPVGQPHISSYAKQAGGAGIKLTIAADTAAPTDAGADCIAVHD